MLPTGYLGTGFCAKDTDSISGLLRDAEGLEVCKLDVCVPKHPIAVTHHHCSEGMKAATAPKQCPHYLQKA